MLTNVYVDAFNLYYGCLKGTSYRWLDLDAFCRQLLPRDRIHRIRYFTALVSGRPGDVQQPQRQQTYLRALRTIPHLSIHLGHYLSHPVRMPLARPPSVGPQTVEVLRTEEKGSDVNLASYLLAAGSWLAAPEKPVPTDSGGCQGNDPQAGRLVSDEAIGPRNAPTPRRRGGWRQLSASPGWRGRSRGWRGARPGGA